MGKKTEKSVEEVAQNNQALVTTSNTPASAIVNDSIDRSRLLSQLGLEEKEWQFQVEPPSHYWKPEENSYIMGIIEGEFTYNNTQYGPLKVYVITLTQPCVGYSTESNQPEMLEIGDVISVAERTAFRELGKNVGRECIIICDGRILTKNNQKFWKIRVGYRKQTEVK